MKTTAVGWWNPRPFDTRSRFHYVTESGRSLCGKWAYISGLIEPGNDEHKDNCAECKNRLRKNNPTGGVVRGKL